MKKPYRLAIVSLMPILLLAYPTKGTTQKACSEKEQNLALGEADNLKNWDAVYLSFKRFGHCDDGAIGEGYSDTVGRLLTADWQHFDVLYRLTAANGSFKQFVLRHIDETLPDDELKSIVTNATLRCPSGKKTLCAQIAVNATRSSKRTQ